jgi:hypothetical protein
MSATSSVIEIEDKSLDVIQFGELNNYVNKFFLVHLLFYFCKLKKGCLYYVNYTN